MPRPEVVAVPAFAARPGGARSSRSTVSRPRSSCIRGCRPRGGCVPGGDPRSARNSREIVVRTVRICDVTGAATVPGIRRAGPLWPRHRSWHSRRYLRRQRYGVLGSRRRSRRSQQRRDDREQEGGRRAVPDGASWYSTTGPRLSRGDSSGTGRDDLDHHRPGRRPSGCERAIELVHQVEDEHPSTGNGRRRDGQRSVRDLSWLQRDGEHVHRDPQRPAPRPGHRARRGANARERSCSADDRGPWRPTPTATRDLPSPRFRCS